MAFMDKVKEVANKTVEQAGDAVDIAKIKTKISGAEKDIVSLKCDIADYFLSQEEKPEAIKDLVAQIEGKFAEIEAFQAEIEELKK